MSSRPESRPSALDHRDINLDMSVFSTEALVGPGLPLWLPAGAIIRQEVEQLSRDIARRDGCMPVYSPVLAKRALFERSGHWSKFSEDMFPPMRLGDEEDAEQLVLRPANCPHHAMIYAAQPRSYRDLPLRLNELGAMFRAERSGVLAGLSRVRQINLDDTHVFCRPDQAAAEVLRALRSALQAQRILGLPVDHVRLSLRDAGAGYLGSAAQWAQAEDALRSAAAEALSDTGLQLLEAEGEAAFYGPKLDLQVRDARDQEETIATVQLDFNQPERFDLGYTDADGTRQRPLMIHRGTVGAVERVVAALLERYRGRLPLWLSPVQVAVMPVSPGQDAAARGLLDDLVSAGLRARLSTDGSLGARIRASRTQRDTVIAVIGTAESSTGQVQATEVATGERDVLPTAGFIDVLKQAHAARSAHLQWRSP